PDGLAVYFRVITERKKAVADLRASEERFKLVARATNDAVWDWDIIADTVWWSEGLEKQFGYIRDQMPPDVTGWTNLIHPDDRDRVLESVHALIEQGGEQWISEYR